jgi:flavin reductase (DIM6/NTAB) family NADH-FMN oxidoreductase RutF
MVMFSSIGRKDTLRNVEETGVFTTSMVGRALTEKMNLSSANAPYGENEFGFSGLEMAEARLINAPLCGGGSCGARMQGDGAVPAENA